MSGQEKRPKQATEEMKLAAAMPIAEEIQRQRPDEKVDELAKQIAKHGRQYTDGYALAKRLDDCEYWDCDLDIAQELDNYASNLDSEIRKAQREWAERTKPQPPFAIGSRVRIPHGDVGEITDIYEHGAAQFLVKVDGKDDSSRRIVNFEDCVAE